MSIVVDDVDGELTTNEVLIAILTELQIIVKHLEQTTDIEFNKEDIEDGH